MKKETHILIGKFLHFLIFLIMFLELMRSHYLILGFMDNNLFVYTVFCCVGGMGLWFSFFSLLDSLTIKDKPCSNCKCKKNLDVDSFKKDFWLWLKINTNFYLCRGHHKEDIENAIKYCICKRINELEKK